jgi:hypothetical protein
MIQPYVNSNAVPCATPQITASQVITVFAAYMSKSE